MEKIRKFRFEDLEIWKEAIRIANNLFDIADILEEKKRFRWAEQLRGAGLSISNNIVEGSASTSKKDFANFLNYARRSVFENVNIIHAIELRKLICLNLRNNIVTELDILSRKIINFQKWLQR